MSLPSRFKPEAVCILHMSDADCNTQTPILLDLITLTLFSEEYTADLTLQCMLRADGHMELLGTARLHFLIRSSHLKNVNSAVHITAAKTSHGKHRCLQL
jgi:hypothetical protein